VSDELLTPTQVAERLVLSTGTVYRYIAEGRLRATKLGDAANSPVRVLASEVERFAASAATVAAPDPIDYAALFRDEFDRVRNSNGILPIELQRMSMRTLDALVRNQLAAQGLTRFDESDYADALREVVDEVLAKPTKLRAMVERAEATLQLDWAIANALRRAGIRDFPEIREVEVESERPFTVADLLRIEPGSSHRAHGRKV
jgi:excisionase family DNA binding protein